MNLGQDLSENYVRAKLNCLFRHFSPVMEYIIPIYYLGPCPNKLMVPHKLTHVSFSKVGECRPTHLDLFQSSSFSCTDIAIFHF